jgi:protein involved in polysaccharide export with SLBB domain
MQPGEDAVSVQRRIDRLVAIGMALVLFVAGCATGRRNLDQAMQMPRTPQPLPAAVAEPYTLGYPDVVEVTIRGQADPTNPSVIGVDGRIDLGRRGRAYVEGQTPEQAVRTVAEQAHVSPDRVRLQIQEYKSRQIYLLGEVASLRRTVPYQGPETAADMLRRVGGIAPGAQPSEVHVIRSHIQDGKSPEVFHVDLRAIFLKHDERTNVVLQPFDQVYVGETRRSRLTKCFPAWLQPIYERLLGLKSGEEKGNEQ